MEPSPVSLRTPVFFALFLWLAGFVAAAPPQAPQRQVLLVPLPSGASWEDLVFLAAVPAASVSDAAVLSVEAGAPLAPETLDFLARFAAQRLLWIGSGPAAEQAGEFVNERLAVTSAEAAACALAERFFPKCATAVACAEADYAAALEAAVLAARLRAPLFFCGEAGASEGTRATLAKLGVKRLVLVGKVEESSKALEVREIVRLKTTQDVARWMEQHDLPVEYLAVAAPWDREAGHVRKLSLAAAVLAAGRNGAVLPVPASAGAAPDVAAVRAALAEFRGKLGPKLEFLCLAAFPDALPMVSAPLGQGIDDDPISDLEYANTDADPFVELAFGRFVAETTHAGTLLAARSLAYERLLAPEFARAVGMAEWEQVCGPVFTNVGFSEPTHHASDKPLEAGSPLTRVAALVHSAHSSWMQLGSTYMHDSTVLVAPCVVESAGCSPASLDQDPEHRSVALRLLRNGAVAFVGDVRRTVAQHELYRSEFWNAVLAGESLGSAHRFALNRMTVSALSRDELDRGMHQYQLHNVTLYGDPALRLKLPGKPRKSAVAAELRGSEITLRGPAEWTRVEQHVPTDWKYVASPKLFGYRAPGVGVEARWDGEHGRNAEELVFTAEVRTTKAVAGLEAIDPPAAPLGWDGRHFVDEHADGSRSILFRVRMLDYVPESGELTAQLKRLKLSVK
jgi:hypothetical protein